MSDTDSSSSFDSPSLMSVLDADSEEELNSNSSLSFADEFRRVVDFRAPLERVLFGVFTFD